MRLSPVAPAWSLSVALAILAHPASAQITTTDLSGALTPTDLAEALAGFGVTVSNVTYVGPDVAAGTFSGGGTAVGFATGVILSTGDIADTPGPNESDETETLHMTAGDTQLDTLASFPTQDAAVLEFDFVPDNNVLFVQYVFASEEYNEFVETIFNDVFAFYVNGTNCALIGMDPVSINTVNNGNPFGNSMMNATNPSFYRKTISTTGAERSTPRWTD
jgi:hypothetical protein